MPAVAVMQSMALGMVATTRRKTRFPTVVTDTPKKGEADNNRHGFLCLYQPLIEATNYGLTPQLTSRNQQQLLQSCQRCVPTASYNVLNPQQDRTPAPWGGPGEGLLLSPFFTLFQYFLPFSFWLLYIFCNFGALIGEAIYLHTTLVVVTRVAETNAIFAPCSRRALHSREGWWETGHDIY